MENSFKYPPPPVILELREMMLLSFLYPKKSSRQTPHPPLPPRDETPPLTVYPPLPDIHC